MVVKSLGGSQSHTQQRLQVFRCYSEEMNLSAKLQVRDLQGWNACCISVVDSWCDISLSGLMRVVSFAHSLAIGQPFGDISFSELVRVVSPIWERTRH